ncbi:uncharacterized protein BT62DRAFT_1011077 [Guyanagaster necrorhizus]|uniref:Uncharacterized protein n=1 Tax=Guyanagaster necrorhizus TaxID=856835 RepID=A0A9P7VJI7_9AGAR|nr:uncharacterized protein BT62DRAFT_1011077 [Guyanagaster necrorhizus MCA 3950]KAG7441782.1 hypothetical protein BT62DRAFT_1011077 [Guyanagaster necrorhizus MCA 3950]
MPTAWKSTSTMYSVSRQSFLLFSPFVAPLLTPAVDYNMLTARDTASRRHSDNRIRPLPFASLLSLTVYDAIRTSAVWSTSDLMYSTSAIEGSLRILNALYMITVSSSPTTIGSFAFRDTLSLCTIGDDISILQRCNLPWTQIKRYHIPIHTHCEMHASMNDTIPPGTDASTVFPPALDHPKAWVWRSREQATSRCEK